MMGWRKKGKKTLSFPIFYGVLEKADIGIV